MADELAALLDAAAVPAPYVVVGHSNGGMVAQLFAATHPDQIAGIVLVDSATEDQDRRAAELLRSQLPSDEAEAMIAAMTAMPPRLIDPEQFDHTTSREQLRASRTTTPLPTVPMTVLVHGLPLDNIPPHLAELYEPIWQDMQRQLAAIVPDSTYHDRRRHRPRHPPPTPRHRRRRHQRHRRRHPTTALSAVLASGAPPSPAHDRPSLLPFAIAPNVRSGAAQRLSCPGRSRPDRRVGAHGMGAVNRRQVGDGGEPSSRPRDREREGAVFGDLPCGAGDVSAAVARPDVLVNPCRRACRSPKSGSDQAELGRVRESAERQFGRSPARRALEGLRPHA